MHHHKIKKRVKRSARKSHSKKRVQTVRRNKHRMKKRSLKAKSRSKSRRTRHNKTKKRNNKKKNVKRRYRGGGEDEGDAEHEAGDFYYYNIDNLPEQIKKKFDLASIDGKKYLKTEAILKNDNVTMDDVKVCDSKMMIMMTEEEMLRDKQNQQPQQP